MKTYRQERKWTHKIVFAVATVAIGVGVLESIAGAMKFEDPDAMAVRVQVLAAQSERAYRIRMLEQGEVRLAAGNTAAGL
jgi:hypothetical protein